MAIRFEAVCPGGLCPGWNVILKGEPSSEAKRFEINFLCERSEEIAFHFNPRFTESLLVCNSYLAKQWGEEERATTCPLEAEEPFQGISYPHLKYLLPEPCAVSDQPCPHSTVKGLQTLLEEMENRRDRLLGNLAQVEIYSDEEYFHVMLDGTTVFQFKHRMRELKSITKLQVLNDVNISSVEIVKKPFL